jgi:uncharacterized membrane protein YfcA
VNPIEDFGLLTAAFVASLFGQGGGVLYTPVQIWSGVDFRTASATSLFLILTISFSSTLVFRQAHEVDWGTALALEAPTTLGAFLGGILSHYISTRTLGLLLSFLMITAAWFMLRPPTNTNRQASGTRPSRWIWQRERGGETYQLDLRLVIPVMLPVGVLTSMVGIGGGVLKVPLMVLLFGVPMSIAVGSSAFMVGLTATGGLLGHASVGHLDWQAALLLAVPVFIGGQIGSRLSVRVDTSRLRKWFGFFVSLVALYTVLHVLGFL